MYDTAHDRFAKYYSDAMFGYAKAASAAYWAMSQDTLRFWSEAVSTVSASSAAGVENWYRPERPVRSALLPMAPARHDTWSFPRFDAANPFSGNALSSPFALWFAMFPMSGSPAAWPMAFAMITSGVPRSVAWPAAEANAAVLDAAEAASETFDKMFASYRSDGGHAASVRTFRNKLMASMWLAPFAMPAVWKWPMAA